MLFAVDQSGKRHHRVDCAVHRFALRTLYEVHVHHLVRHAALKVQRDAHAVSRERTPESKKFHGNLHCLFSPLRSEGPPGRVLVIETASGPQAAHLEIRVGHRARSEKGRLQTWQPAASPEFGHMTGDAALCS